MGIEMKVVEMIEDEHGWSEVALHRLAGLIKAGIDGVCVVVALHTPVIYIYINYYYYQGCQTRTLT